MTVSFDGLISTYKIAYHERLFIVRYDASTGLYTADVSNPTTFDLFRDDATVGDWIGWGWSRGVWHDLALTIGTALAGSGITLAWEYSSYNPSTGAIVWTLLTVTDGTSGLTTSGTVAFAVPDAWRFTASEELSASLSAYAAGPIVRCRLAAATSVTEGGEYTAKVDGKDFAIRVVGSETPASVYAADVTAGWGRMTRAGTDLYSCDANLRIGDGVTATTLAISGGAAVHVGTHDLTSAATRRYYKKRTLVAENAIDTLSLGVKGVEAGTDVYSSGASLTLGCFYNPIRSYFPYNFLRCAVACYGSTIRWLSDVVDFSSSAFYGAMDLRGSILDAGGAVYISGNIPVGGLVQSCVYVGSSSSNLYVYDSDISITGLVFARGTGVTVGTTTTIVGLDFKATRKLNVSNSGSVVTAQDCTFAGSLSTQVVLASGTSASLSYSCEIIAQDSHGQSLSGFHIRMVDSAGTVIYSGVYSSAIVATVYTAVNVAGTITRTNLNPVEIWISKPGYLTVYRKFTLDNDSRKVQVTLLHSPTPGRASMGSAIR